MQSKAKRTLHNRAKSRLFAASLPVVEFVESRIFMSTTIANWSFDSLSIGTNLTPPADSGSVAGASATTVAIAGDTSDILNGTGNLAPKTSDNSSTGQTAPGNVSGTNPAWRVRGTGNGGDGWVNNGVVASQGAQFTADTTGQSNITFSFDLDPSSGSAPSAIAVQYNTNFNNASGWVTVPAADYSLANYHNSANSATDGMSIQSNSGNANIVNGGYFQVANPATTGNNDPLFWQNGLSVNLTSIPAVNNDPTFGLRVVNATTGAAQFTVAGAAYSSTLGTGNWRFDNINISSNPSSGSPPTIPSNGNPANQAVAAGQPVTFTASSTGGTPTPTVQWYIGVPPSGTAISAASNPSATTTSLTFTTQSNASDNGTAYYAVFTNASGNATTTAATLSDPLAAVAITTQPTAVSVAPGASASFTAAATGSPAPTVQWQSSPDNSTWTNISGATSTTYNIASTTVSQNNTFYRAAFTNSQSPSGVATSSAKLSVVGATLAAWSFPTAVAAPDNTPAPTTGSGSALSLGMTNTYAYASTTATNSVTSDDITGVAGTVPSLTENVWRVRGAYVATGIAPNIGSPTNSKNVNGWNLNAPQYSQGVEFDVSTVGYQSIQASFDWESTNQGVKNLQEQYNTDVTNSAGWTNINSPLVAVPGQYLLANPIDLSSISGTNNDPHFGIRLVSAYDANGATDGLTQVTDANGTHYPYTGASGGVYNNSSGNWGFDNISITGAQIPTAPAITTQPANTTVAGGSQASFTAAASGFPVPTVQWEVSTDNGTSFSPISGATSTTYTITSATTAQTGTEYEAVFTNNVSPFTATTNPATLTVTSLPAVTTQPLSQSVGAGTSVSLTSAASGLPAPTVQWQVATPNGSGGFNAFSNITGATSATYTFTATETSSGDEYQAVWTNTAGSATSSAATVVVIGTPIAQWNFTGGEAPTAQSTAPGTANAPYPTLGSYNPSASVPVPNSSQTLGLANNYAGTTSVPEADILPERSVINSSFNEDVWRVRGGSGLGPTGSPGTPAGWSQLAPQYSQGVGFAVNTAGFSNVTLQFDWNQGGVGAYQAQYLNASSQWTNVGSLIQSNGSDYYGIGNTTAPTGVLVNLQGITIPNNNLLQLRLASAYAPTSSAVAASLPAVVDGNTADPTLHGQFPAAGAPALENAQQMLTIPDGTSSGTLSFNNLTTGNISFNADATTNDAAQTAANIASALNALTGLSGDFSVAPTAQDSSGALYTVTFKGALAHTPENSLISTSLYTNLLAVGVQTSGTYTLKVTDGTSNYTTAPIAYNASASDVQTALRALGASGAAGFTVSQAGDDNLFGSYPMYAVNLASDTGATLSVDSAAPLSTPSNLVVTTPVQQWSYGTSTATGVAPFVDGGGSFVIGNIRFSGHSANGVPGITLSPTSGTVTAGVSTTLTATAYSDSALTGAQWQVSTNGGTTFTNIAGATNLNAATGTSTYTFTPPASQETANPAVEYQCVFTNGNGSTPTAPATLTVVAPVVPAITLQPLSTSAQAGFQAVFTATASGTPAPTVQWQISSDGGSTYTNLTDSATVSGSTGTTLVYTTNANGTENGDLIRAVFTNSGGILPTNAVTMTVLGNETQFTAWNFASYANSGNAALDNSPAPTTGNGTASIVGMVLPYNPSDPATGTDFLGSFAAGDVTSSPGSLNPNFSENTWRIRAGVDQQIAIASASLTNDVATLTTNLPVGNLPLNSVIQVQGMANNAYNGTFTVTAIGNNTISFADVSANLTSETEAVGAIAIGTGVGGTPANGWSNFLPQYSQGAQFSASSVGYKHIYVTMDWYSTTSGELDGQEQYTTDGTNWVNIPNGHVQAVSNDFYGATATGGPIPLVIDVSNLPAADNDPNFGVRLVNAYNPILTAKNGTGTYANAALVGNPPGPAAYNGSKGNWRFDNIEFHGVPDWLSNASQAVYNPATNTLAVTGPTTIISDPESTAGGNIPVDPLIVGSTADAQVAITPATSPTDVHIGGVTLTNGAGIDVTSVGGGRTHDNHNVLVVGTISQASAPPFSADSLSKVNLEDNDLIIHGGNDGSGDFSAAQLLAASGRNGTNGSTGNLLDGTWTGNGLTSSAAAAQVTAQGQEYTALAVVQNADLPLGQYSSWAVGSSSEPLRSDGNDVIVKYTYIGDWALEGLVGDDAQTIFGANFDTSVPLTWANGSYNGGALNDDAQTAFGAYFGNGSTQGGPQL